MAASAPNEPPHNAAINKVFSLIRLESLTAKALSNPYIEKVPMLIKTKYTSKIW
jgi:hypothetical protein